ALRHPFSSPPLRVLAKKRRNAVILVSDITRLCPTFLFAERLVDELNAGGLGDHRIRIIVALGMHRKLTQAELKDLVGAAVFQRVQVLNHSALSEDCLPLGRTALGTPVEINRIVAEADLRI